MAEQTPQQTFTKVDDGKGVLEIQGKNGKKRVILVEEEHEEVSDRIWENLRRGHRTVDLDMQ